MEESLSDLETLNRLIDDSVPEETWEALERVLRSSLLPKLEFGFDRPAEKSDFEAHIPLVTCNLKVITRFLHNLVACGLHKSKKQKIKSDIVVLLLILCGEHGAENNWTCDESIKQCCDILSSLCEYFNCRTVPQLLTGDDCDLDSELCRLLKPTLIALRPKLLKDTWKNYPGAVACYTWLLFQLNYKYLGDYLSMVLPTALILTDDFVPENALTGVKCLHHIVENVTKTDLFWHADVIYAAVKQCLYHRDVVSVKATILCLIVVLDRLERSYHKKETLTEWCKYDDSLGVILETMELCQQSALLEAYMEVLPSFLDNMPLSIVNWSYRLLPLFEENLKMVGYYSPVFSKCVSLALKTYLVKTWPRIPHHCKRILKMLLRFLLDVTNVLSGGNGKNLSVNDHGVYEEVVVVIEECLQIVVACDPETVKKYCSEFKKDTHFNKKFHNVVLRCLELP